MWWLLEVGEIALEEEKEEVEVVVDNYRGWLQ
jgi:hypothetical protein